jgi:hypothetical protein
MESGFLGRKGGACDERLDGLADELERLVVVGVFYL